MDQTVVAQTTAAYIPVTELPPPDVGVHSQGHEEDECSVEEDQAILSNMRGIYSKK